MAIIDEFCREYKRITEELLISAEKDEFDRMDELLSSRQDLLERFSKENFDKSSFADELNNQGIVDMELKLKNLLEEKKDSFISYISNIEKNKKANQTYNTAFFNNSQSILSRKV